MEAQSAPEDAIVIRTMQDDLSDLQKNNGQKNPSLYPAPLTTVSGVPVSTQPVSRQPQPPPLTPSPPPISPAPPSPPVISTAPPAPPLTPPPPPPRQFPLPPRSISTGKPQKVVTQPRHFFISFSLPWLSLPWSGLKRWFLIGVGGIALVGAVGGLGWVWWNQGSTPQVVDTSEDLIADNVHILPRSVLTMVRYDTSSDKHRAVILGAWNETKRDLSLTNLLAGDPRTLLSDVGINEIFYVTLADEKDPYLVVQKTAATTSVINKAAEAKVTERDGWYIVHATSTEPYIQSLNQGVLGDAEELSHQFKEGLATAPLRFFISTQAVTQLREQLVGRGLSAGQLSSLILDGHITPTGLALQFSGSVPLPLLINTQIGADYRLLTTVPADARSFHLGANFAEDIQRWQTAAKVLNPEVLNRPAVVDLIGLLSGPYAFYSRRGLDGEEDLGLIIPLPSDVQKTLELGDSTIEEALFALAPWHISNQPTATISFSERTYNETTLRYVNLNTPLKALDYTITNGYLLIASSREGMLALIDTIKKTSPAVSADAEWQPLLREWGNIPPAHDYLSGVITYAPLQQLLPTKQTAIKPLSFGAVIQPEREKVLLRGLLSLGAPPVTSSPAPSASPGVDINTRSPRRR